MISEKTIERLSQYRHFLREFQKEKVENISSSALADRCHGQSAQVRRDLMEMGYRGKSTRGYEVEDLLAAIGAFLDRPGGEKVALCGIGNLGRALLTYFQGSLSNLQVVAAFDRDPHKTGRVIHGCRCYDIEMVEKVIADEGIRVAIIAVPGPDAQRVADRLFAAGIKGLLNFAPTPVRVPPKTYVEHMDMTMALEKVSFFTRQLAPSKGASK